MLCLTVTPDCLNHSSPEIQGSIAVLLEMGHDGEGAAALHLAAVGTVGGFVGLLGSRLDCRLMLGMLGWGLYLELL